MLKLAKAYESELNSKILSIAYEEKYKFIQTINYYNYTIEVDNNSWNSLQFVSVNKDNDVIGYFKANIDRSADMVDSLQVMNFYDINLTFSKDFHKFLMDLFNKYSFRKVKFSVLIGNPAEKMYDKYIEKYNGRIVGINKEEVKLFDGKYYDFKQYEILSSDFYK